MDRFECAGPVKRWDGQCRILWLKESSFFFFLIIFFCVLKFVKVLSFDVRDFVLDVYMRIM